MRTTAALALALAACGAPGQVTVGNARLPEAWGVIPVPDGPRVELMPGQGAVEVPAGDGTVVLAIDRDVPYREVDAVLTRLRAEGRAAVTLVARRSDVRAFEIPAPTGRPAIRIVATADGKACVSPPGVAEAKCVQRADKLHIDRAYTRELVREAVNGYHLEAAYVRADDALAWADVVRAVDGARSCCGERAIDVTLGSNL